MFLKLKIDLSTMPQFMIEKDFALNDTVEIGGDDAHHITHVLRLKVGDWIILSDGRGSRYRCEIQNINRKSVTALVKEVLSFLKPAEITLAQAITKHDKLEFIIQKAVELGVTNIIPFSSSRTIPKYSKEVSEKKTERWNKIAVQASKQCGFPIKPVVRSVMGLDELLRSPNDFQNKLMFYEGEQSTTLKKYFTHANIPAGRHSGTIILIGPEGGFTDDEVKLAREHGFTTLNLGPLIMRVETAAIAAITLTQYFLGHFD